MNDRIHPALLPVGLRDLLPPEAAHEAAAVERMIAVFAAHGYARVKPPLVEFEDSLLSGAGAAMAKETFRLMDPISQRMIGLRADITTQIARIAESRLRNAPRPLRLCYAGQVLRVKGSQLRPARQVGQVGAELIGPAGVAADVEVVVLAVEALAALGVAGLSVDLNLPPLVPALCGAMGVSGATFEAARAALDRKDAAAVARLGGSAAQLLAVLLAAAGPAERALQHLATLDLPGEAAAERTRLGDVVAALRRSLPDLPLTVDPVENRGFEYHTGITFTLFARGVRGELGRGGRYRAGDGASEAATGVTLYTDTVLRAMPAPPAQRSVFLPAGTPPTVGRRLRAEGWITVAELEPAGDARAEARRLGCTHVLADGTPAALD